MSNLIEIPDHLLPLFPESVPLLDADEIWSPSSSQWKTLSIMEWINRVFKTNRNFGEMWELCRFIEKEFMFERNIYWPGQCKDIEELAWKSDDTQMLATIWNNVMTRLGYTEVSDDLNR